MKVRITIEEDLNMVSNTTVEDVLNHIAHKIGSMPFTFAKKYSDTTLASNSVVLFDVTVK